MNKQILLVAFMLFSLVSIAQVGIGNTDPKATLDVTGVTTASVPSGVLVPRFTQAELAAKDGAYLLDQNGVLVFVSAVSTQTGKTSNITAVGFHYYNHATLKWVAVDAPAVPYEKIRGKVTSVNAATYTIAADDYIVQTIFNAAINITFPPLTNTAADIGRVVHVFNNNTINSGLFFNGIIGPGTATNQFRGRFFVWTGTQWANVGL